MFKSSENNVLVMAGDVWYDPDLLSAIIYSDRSKKPVGPPHSQSEGSGAPLPASSTRLEYIESRLSAIDTILSRLARTHASQSSNVFQISGLQNISTQLKTLIDSFNKLHDVVKKSHVSDCNSYLDVIEGHLKNVLDRLDNIESKISALQSATSVTQKSQTYNKGVNSQTPTKLSNTGKGKPVQKQSSQGTQGNKRRKSTTRTSANIISDVSEGTDIGNDEGSGGVLL